MTPGTRLSGRRMTHLSVVRRDEHHGSFREGESRKWTLTDFGSKGVLKEGHCQCIIGVEGASTVRQRANF